MTHGFEFIGDFVNVSNMNEFAGGLRINLSWDHNKPDEFKHTSFNPTTGTEKVTISISGDRAKDLILGRLVSNVINIDEDRLNAIGFSLIDHPPDKAIISLQSSPDQAKIFIDDIDIGQVTTFNAEVDPGDHSFKFIKEGFLEQTIFRNVTVGTNPRIMAFMTAEPTPPPLSFWERLKDSISETLTRLGWIFTPELVIAFNLLSKFLFDKDLDETDALDWIGQIPGVNILSKIVLGKDLRGNPAEELTTLEFAELALLITPWPDERLLPFFKAVDSKTAMKLIENKPSKFLPVIYKQTSRELSTKIAPLIRLATGKGLVLGFIKRMSLKVSLLAATTFGFVKAHSGSPKSWGIFIAIVFLLKFVGFDLPGYTANLRKEIPEALAMATWAAIDNAKRLGTKEAWILANETNQKYYEFINITDIATKDILRLNPYLKDLYLSSSDAAREQADTYQKIIDANIAEVTPPPPPPPPPNGNGDDEDDDDDEEPPAPGTAFVSVNSTPQGANIWIDGKSKFVVTPFALLLESGPHNIQVQLFRHKPGFKNITVEGGINQVVEFELDPIPTGEPEEPFVPVPIEIELEPDVPEIIKPDAWEYTITARAADTGKIINAKIIIDGIFTDKFTTNNIILEPESEYLLRLEAFGFQSAEAIIRTEALPST